MLMQNRINYNRKFEQYQPFLHPGRKICMYTLTVELFPSISSVEGWALAI